MRMNDKAVINAPTRGFETAEYQQRIERAQKEMQNQGLDALFLTTQEAFAYFTGFQTQFWLSPTRPWYLLLPQSGQPCAVIPSIGAALMQRSNIARIYTWAAPDLVDDGLSLLATVIREQLGESAKIGLPSTMESYLRMPLADWARLQASVPGVTFCSDNNIVRDLRLIKSTAEIAKVQTACAIADRAFARVPETLRAGMRLDQVSRLFQQLCLDEGADQVPYLALGLGHGGYDDVISPADGRFLERGMVLMLDTGLVWDGYYCDFNRNFLLETPETFRAHQKVLDAHKQLIAACDAAIAMARPGVRIDQLWHCLSQALKVESNAGRLGHGLGMNLTEWPSIIAQETLELKENMLMTIEPSIPLDNGRLLVHEENIVITKTGARYLSSRYGEAPALIYG